MPGEPAETMIGVGVLGFGSLMLFCAVKNVSPVALLRQAITTGNLTLDGLPPLYGGLTSQLSTIVPTPVVAAIAQIATKDPTLAAQITAECGALAQSINDKKPKAYADTKHLFDLMSKARSLGFASEVDTIEHWVNGLALIGTPATGSGTVTI